MASRPELDALREAWLFGEPEYDDLADELYAAKVEAYLAALERELERLGFDAEVEEEDLPAAVLGSLEQDAEQSARRMVMTYNRELNNWLDRHHADELVDLQDGLEDWAEERARSKAKVAAVTDVYAPAADATLALHGLTGAETLFEFGGHGDLAPVCDICQALEETNPHPAQRVLAFGTPHVNCRQSWHPLYDEGRLPDEIDLAELAPLGLAGADTLLERAGGVAAAAELVRRSA